MTLLNKINAKHIKDFSRDELKELQQLLNRWGYSLVVDGIFGVKTETAFLDFKKQNKLTEPYLFGKTTLDFLLNIPTKRQINQTGLDLIKEFEGFESKAYPCPSGIITIGYGLTFYPDGRKVKMGDRITREEAERLLKITVQTFADGVSKAVKVPLTSNQFSALVSLCFNIGIGAFQKSTLVRVLNQGNYSEAANQFLRWNRGDGKVLAGLVRRRTRERELFLS